MSREIKFRFWVESILPEETGMYYPGYFLLGVGDGGNTWIDKLHTTKNGVSYKFTDDTTKLTPMQFTGLLDKNGKEIYEGDIVRVPDRYEWQTNPPTTIRVVDFENGCFGPFDPGNEYGPLAEDCEVIGNIYENPELLEGRAA